VDSTQQLVVALAGLLQMNMCETLRHGSSNLSPRCQ
jgi:hypothetical protein